MNYQDFHREIRQFYPYILPLSWRTMYSPSTSEYFLIDDKYVNFNNNQWIVPL